MNERQVAELFAQAMGPVMAQLVGSGQKASGTPAVGVYPYSVGGLFGRCDGPSQLINALVGPIGIERELTWVGNDTEYEFVDTLASMDESGSEQSTSCGDCVTVSTTACSQFYCFGRFCRQTEELLFDRIGLKANANVPVKTMFGAITDAMGNTLVASGDQITDVFYLQTRLLGYALRYKNSQLIWTGDPANSTPSYQEYLGLQQLVNTGKYDAYTQQACDAIDSFLLDFNYQAPASAGTYAIINWMRRMVLQFMTRAGGANFDWATADMMIVMNSNLWDCIARAYACNGIELCTAGDASDREFTSSADQARARYEQYTSSMLLPIYGRDYRVVLDSQVPVDTGQPGGVCGDVYFLTKSINGQEVLYGEYQDFNSTYGRVQAELRAMFGSDDISIVDNGRYAMVRDNERGCFDLQGYVKPRLVMLTPWLAGRLQNVCCDVIGEPLPDPALSGTVYELGGGRSSAGVPTLYGGCA